MAGTDSSASLLPTAAHMHSPPQTAISKPAFPMRIENYMIDDVVLGRGHYAIVRLATHTPTMEKVAVKCFEKAGLDITDTLRMRREISVVSKLRHPNIVRTYQVLENDLFAFIVMEYAAGGEMFDQISSQGPYEETEARALFRQLVSAVRYCHNRNLVHRDLKTENVLLDHDRNVKLADFGFCDVLIPGEALEECCGSLPYAPPEIFYGKLYDGFKSDVWSLGVVLYVMLCGTLPFNEDKPDDTRQAILSGIFEIPNYLSVEAKDLIRQMLNIDYTTRLGLAAVIAHPWLSNDLESPSSSDALLEEMEDAGRLDNELNEYVLDEMQNMGHGRDTVRMAVTDGQHNDISATYDILDDRFHRHFAKRISSPITLAVPSTTDSPRRSSIVTGVVEPSDAEKLRQPVLTLSIPEPTMEYPTGRRGSLPLPLSFPAAFGLMNINRHAPTSGFILPQIIVPDDSEDARSNRFSFSHDTSPSRRTSDISMDLGSLADDDSDEEPDLSGVQRYLTVRGRSTRGTVGHYGVRKSSNSVTSAYENWLSPTRRRHSDTPTTSTAQRMTLERMYHRGIQKVDSGLGSPYLRTPSPMMGSPQPRFRFMNASQTSLDMGHYGPSLTIPRTSASHGRSSPGLSFLDKIYSNNPKQ